MLTVGNQDVTMLNVLSPPEVVPFPADAVEAFLRDALATAAADQAAIRAADTAASSTGSAGWEPEVDSIVALDVLTALGVQLGIELPDDVVPAGGYPNVERCIEHLLGKARSVWSEKHREAVV